jgi:hypothetical protein
MSQLWIDRIHGASGSPAGSVNRLRRFPENRFIGRRDIMVVFDCDDREHFQELSQSAGDLGLEMRNALQAFAPDTIIEASNRGFVSRS